MDLPFRDTQVALAVEFPTAGSRRSSGVRRTCKLMAWAFLATTLGSFACSSSSGGSGPKGGSGGRGGDPVPDGGATDSSTQTGSGGTASGGMGEDGSGATGGVAAGAGGAATDGSGGSTAGGRGGRQDTGSGGAGAGTAGTAGAGGAVDVTAKPPWPAPLSQTFTGQWIWQAAAGPANTWMAFRKTVSLTDPPASVKAFIAADSKYWLWINGRPVVFEGALKRGPTPSDSYVDEVDIGPYLVNGPNTIAALVWYFGRSGFSSMDSGKGGFMFQAMAGGTTIATDQTWKVKVHTGYGPQTLSAPNYRLAEWNVEYDGRNDLGDWTASAFVDSSWAAPTAKGAPPAAPWVGCGHVASPSGGTQGSRTTPTSPAFPPAAAGP